MTDSPVLPVSLFNLGLWDTGRPAGLLPNADSGVSVFPIRMQAKKFEIEVISNLVLNFLIFELDFAFFT